MRNSKGYSRLFAVLGTVLAVAAVVLCFWARNASARLLVPPRDAVQCAETVLDRICAGDFAGASEYLYGNPKLDSGREQDSDTGRVIWEAFVASLEYELEGSGYATANGIAQKAHIRSLRIPSVTENLKQRAQTLLEQRVMAAEDMDEVYNDKLEYREDFVLGVLRDAAVQAAAEDGQIVDQELEINLVYDRDQWWVVPDQALLNAISGGILGNA